jgi:hypothetical protein
MHALLFNNLLIKISFLGGLFVFVPDQERSQKWPLSLSDRPEHHSQSGIFQGRKNQDQMRRSHRRWNSTGNFSKLI